MIEINCKFADRALVPNRVLPSGWISGEVKTRDGEICQARFLSIWDNEGDRYASVLDDICQRFWGIPFRAIRSMWYSRIGDPGNYWCLLKMEKK